LHPSTITPCASPIRGSEANCSRFSALQFGALLSILNSTGRKQIGFFAWH
jgi:hypothetical protein